MKPRALIVGGSVGGLFAANLLRRAGWDVQVFERTAGSLGDRGTGIGTRNELFDVMRRAGLQVEPSIGVAVRGRIGLARDGRVLESVPMPAVTSGWSHVWRPLKKAIPAELYRSGAALVSFEQAGGHVSARFADGTEAEGDLLIGADGLHSTVRTNLLPELKPQYVGYVAWRGVVNEHEVDTTHNDLIFEHMVFGFPERGLFLSLPMPGAEAGDRARHRRTHFVWFQPASEAELTALCTDANGKQHGVAIAPPLIRPELIARLKADADALLPPQLAGLVHAAKQIILQPIFELESSRLTFGRVALLGDAAFVARPHVATGVMKAALDAQALSDALAADNIEDALQRYDEKRQTFGRWLVARGRHIGTAIVATAGAPNERMSTLMREYGAAGVVNATRITAQAAR